MRVMALTMVMMVPVAASSIEHLDGLSAAGPGRSV
jgi:hypothetical protein